MRQETTAWERHRNHQNATVDWRFTTSDARIKLKRITRSYRCYMILGWCGPGLCPLKLLLAPLPPGNAWFSRDIWITHF